MRAIVTDFAVGIAGFRGPNNVGCRVTSCASRCRPSFDKFKSITGEAWTIRLDVAWSS